MTTNKRQDIFAHLKGEEGEVSLWRGKRAGIHIDWVVGYDGHVKAGLIVADHATGQYEHFGWLNQAVERFWEIEES